MALDMQSLEFFCSEEPAGGRMAMVFRQRRRGLLRWFYLYECPACGNIARASLSGGRLKIEPHLAGATRRNQRRRSRAS